VFSAIDEADLKSFHYSKHIFYHILEVQHFMKKKLFLMCLIVTGLLIFAACANQAQTPAAPAPAPEAPAEPAPAPEPEEEDADDDDADEADANDQDAATHGTGVSLIMYSNAPVDILEQISERAAVDGFDLAFVRAGGGEIAERLVAERHNPIADVVMELNVFLWQNLIDNDVIVPFVPVWADQIPAELNHPGGYYHFTGSTAILLTYDADQLEEAPTDWMDLWLDPRFHGLYQFETSLGGGTTRMVLSGILSRYADPDGHLGVSDEGWYHIERFYRYGVPNTAGANLFANMTDPNSTVVMGQLNCLNIPVMEEQFDVNAGFMVPAVGVPWVITGLAVTNNDSNMEEAQRFVNWLSPDIFEELEINVLSPRFADIPMQVIDWEFVAAHIDQWVEHIYLTYMP